MTPSEVTKTIELCLLTLKPLFIRGSPGVGKTATVHSTALRADCDVIDLRLPQMDSVDLRGLPITVKLIREGRVTSEYETRWISPAFLPKAGGRRTVLFLDELSAALPSVQVAAYQLIQERRLGEYTLPRDCLVIGAGNKATDRAVVNRMSSALCNKMMMVDYDVSANDWCGWAMRSKIEPEIISCIRAQPDLLFNFDSKTWIDGTNFASPRSWHALDDAIKACPDVFALGKSTRNVDSLRSWEIELIQGIVGPAAGMAFFMHLRHYISLPTPQQIIKDPDGAPVPTNASAMHAVSASLMRFIDSSTIGPIIKYLKRMQRDFLYYVLCQALTDNKSLIMDQECQKFVADNADLFGMAQKP